MNFNPNENMDYILSIAVEYGLNTVLFLLGLFATWLLARFVKRIIIKAFQKASVDYSLQTFLSKIIYWMIIAIGLISCLSIFGIQTASFAAVLASMGFAVGMALKGTLGNLASGAMLLIFRPFTTGDTVKIAGTSGVVAEIDIFNTVINTFDNVRVTIPSQTVFDSQIENMTYHQTRRINVSVGTSYKDDITKARQVLMNTILATDGVLKDPAPAVVLTELANSSINWAVRAWVNTADYWAIRDKLLESIKLNLDKNKIEIPFPQVQVSIDNNRGDQ